MVFDVYHITAAESIFLIGPTFRVQNAAQKIPRRGYDRRGKKFAKTSILFKF